jgi:uncharacterized membrane protein (DUF373 family)
LLILVELFRLLIIYLQEHRVSIGVAVEVSIVSVLREIIVKAEVTPYKCIVLLLKLITNKGFSFQLKSPYWVHFSKIALKASFSFESLEFSV